MNEVKPSVILLEHDFDISLERTLCALESNLVNVYTAFRRCYKGGENDTFLEYNTDSDEINISHIKEFISKMRKSPHESPLEFGKLTFAISGVSRSFSHQWVRSRIASHAQMSQRYVDHSNLDVVVPESIKNNSEAYMRYTYLIGQIEDFYNDLVTKYEVPKEDARYILNEGTATAIVSQFNFRELIHIFKERCCNRTQWEYRYVANEMLRLCKQYYPCVFENVGPKCIDDRTGKFLGCPEAHPCGNPPVKK